MSLLLFVWRGGDGAGVPGFPSSSVLPLPSALSLVLLCLADLDPGVVHPGASTGGAPDDSASSSDEVFLEVRDFLEISSSCLDVGGGFVAPIATMGKIWSSLILSIEQSASLLDGLPKVLSL